MSDIVIGAVCVVERRFFHTPMSVPPQHRWEKTITKVTAKRAYFERNYWFALDDPEREVKPRYLDYRANVVEVRAPNESVAETKE